MKLNQTIEWSRIMEGKPIDFGRLVYGIGNVQVSKRNEREALESGGDPLEELSDASSANGQSHWIIIGMIPRSPEIVEQGKREKLRLQLLKWYFDGYHTNSRQPLPYGIFKEENPEFKDADDREIEAAWSYLLNQKHSYKCTIRGSSYN